MVWWARPSGVVGWVPDMPYVVPLGRCASFTLTLQVRHAEHGHAARPARACPTPETRPPCRARLWHFRVFGRPRGCTLCTTAGWTLVTKVGNTLFLVHLAAILGGHKPPYLVQKNHHIWCRKHVYIEGGRTCVHSSVCGGTSDLVVQIA